MFIKGGDTARAARKATTSSRPRSLKKCGRLPMVGALAVLIAAVMLLTGIGAFGADAQAAVTVESSNSTDSTAESDSFNSPTTGEMWRTGTGDNPMMLVGISWFNDNLERTIDSVTWTPRSAGSATTLTEVKTQTVSRREDKNTSYHGTAIYAWPTGTTIPSNQEGYLTVTFDGIFFRVARHVTLGMVNFNGVDQTNPWGEANSATNASGNNNISVSVERIADGMVFDSVTIGGKEKATPSLAADSSQDVWWSLAWTHEWAIYGTRGAASTRLPASGGDQTTMSWTAGGPNCMWAIAAVPLRPAAVTHTINASAGTGGTISPTSETVNHGDSSGDFTISPTDGYELGKLTDNDADVTTLVSGGKYSIANVTEDHTLVVTFKKVQYNLTYTAGANGKLTGPTTQTVAHGEDGTEVEAVPDAGYSFVDWSDGRTDNPRTDTDVTANLNATASFAPNSYTITFDTDGGSEVGPITKAFGTQVTPPENPTKEGCTFDGWDPALPETMPAESRTVTAQWEVNSYTITFNTDGGSSITPATYEFGAEVIAPGAPTKEGHTFTGWEPALPKTMPAKNMTVTAKWSIDQYTITFDTDGGSPIALATYEFGAEVSAPGAPTKEGYTFTGWEPELPATMPAENRTVTAKWKVNTYTVTFDANGGSAPAPSTMTVTFDAAYGTQATTSRAGYTFVGWFTARTGGNEVTAATLVGRAEDHTLYAQWSINKHTITFYSAGGSEVGPIIQDFGTPVTPPENPTKEGHTFTGWDPALPETMPAEDQTVTAKWKVNTYTIAFDTDGGSEVDSITQDFGTPVSAPEAPTKEGHTFTGWEPELPATMPAGDLTVTAQWSIDQYAITATVDPTAGGTVIGTGTYDHGEEVTLTAIPATGYHFTGWTEDGETIDGADTTYTFTAQADRTLGAEFALNEYTITVDAMPLAGGTVSDGGVYLHGAEVTVEAIPAPGYRFDRWDDATTATTYSHLPTYTFSADGDISLVARFVKEDTTYFTLTYTAGPGGTIVGEATQRVEAGSDGTMVTAVPDPGYRFVRWSDGFTSATRTDTDIQGDISVTAEFAPVAPTKDRWSDISDSAWQRVYGISVDQAYAVAQGYGDGTFRPADPLTRAHCAKMIVDGFGVERLLPDAPTFSDVRASHPQYGWIEGGYAAKVVNGYADGTFRPANNILRQQFNSMLARVFVQQEIDARGGIQGTDGTIYETLGAWYEAEGAGLLARFADGGSIYRDHRANTAYLILRGVVKGGEQDGVRFLDPLKNLTRAQAVAMIVRAGLAAEDF